MAGYHIEVQLADPAFTIEPRPSGAVIPGAFTHSFFNGAVLIFRLSASLLRSLVCPLLYSRGSVSVWSRATDLSHSYFRGSKRTSPSVLTLAGWPPLTVG